MEVGSSRPRCCQSWEARVFGFSLPLHKAVPLCMRALMSVCPNLSLEEYESDWIGAYPDALMGPYLQYSHILRFWARGLQDMNWVRRRHNSTFDTFQASILSQTIKPKENSLVPSRSTLIHYFMHSHSTNIWWEPFMQWHGLRGKPTIPSGKCAWCGLLPETLEWLPMPLGRFPNFSTIHKVAKMWILHSYNPLTCLLLQLNSLSTVVPNI